LRDDRIDVFSLSLRGYFESFVRVFIFAEHSDSSCSSHERRESQEGGFNSSELYIALFRLQKEIATPARLVLSNFGTKKIGTGTIDPIRISRCLRAFVKIRERHSCGSRLLAGRDRELA